jgi:hypothetical protein
MRAKSIFSLCAALAVLPACAEDQDGPKLDYHGAGWVQGGRVENSMSLQSDGNAYDKNWVGQSGGLLAIHTSIDEHWDASLGLGTVLVQLARGSRQQASKWYPFWVSWVDEARITYATKFGEANEFKLNMGSFHYGYNADIKNFGQYLMYGYVYPGTIVTSLTGPLGVNQTINGLMGTLKLGAFSNDLITKVETEDKPYYDISVADVATFKVGSWLEIGAGVNFYRLLPSNSKFTSPGKDCLESELGPYANHARSNPCYILDTVSVDGSGTPTRIDTITGSLSGTKLMGRLRLDPKAAVGYQNGGLLGKDDFVLYTELAVIGLKDYPKFYKKITQRIPVMIGLNLPGFNLFNWSVEVEYYGSPNSGDNLPAQSASWIPNNDDPAINPKRDDWKYSVNASKGFGGNLVLMAQVANDDLRLGGNHDDAAGKQAMRTPSDWYWTTKIAYFF